MIQQFSGNIPWTYSSFSITPGSHTLQFNYEKDNVYSTGDDCAWLDNIKFPNSATITSIKNITANKSFSYWPNPASDLINIQAKSELSSIQVFDNVGKLIFNQILDTNSRSNIISIPCGEWQNGVYNIVAIRLNYEWQSSTTLLGPSSFCDSRWKILSPRETIPFLKFRWNAVTQPGNSIPILRIATMDLSQE
jgi:hypothetical protein